MINQKRTESVAGMIMLHIAGAISLAELAIDDPTVDLSVLRAHLQVGAAESGTVLEQAIWETHKDMFVIYVPIKKRALHHTRRGRGNTHRFT